MPVIGAKMPVMVIPPPPAESTHRKRQTPVYAICKYCKKQFEKKRKWQLFCKTKCSNGFHNDKKALSK